MHETLHSTPIHPSLLSALSAKKQGISYRQAASRANIYLKVCKIGLSYITRTVSACELADNADTSDRKFERSEVVPTSSAFARISTSPAECWSSGRTRGARRSTACMRLSWNYAGPTEVLKILHHWKE